MKLRWLGEEPSALVTLNVMSHELTLEKENMMTRCCCSSLRLNGSVGLSLPSATFFAVTVVVSAVFVSSRSFTSITVYASPGELTVTDSVSNEAYTPSWGAPRLEPLSKSYIAKSTRSGVTGSPVSESTSEKRSPTSVPVCRLI